jgi:hypothetical protein
MIRILTTILVLTFSLNAFSQKISVDTLFISTGEEVLTHSQNDKLKFPIVRTGNLKIDSLINQDLKHRFMGYEFHDIPIDSTIIKWARNNIINLDFEITFNKHNLISLNISAEGCGAYCTSWTEYFTYSGTTGKYLTINEIIDIAGKFQILVISDTEKQYHEQRTELKEMFLNEESGLDEETYQLVLDYYETCEKSFEIKDFALYDDYLQIIHECHLPRVIRNLNPNISLIYKFNEIEEHLKIKN